MEKANLLNSFYEINSLLTRSPDFEEVLNKIVDRAMNGLKFDRAIIMLLSDDKTKLECKCVKGFTPMGEKRALEKPLDMNKHDCFETRVIKYAKPQFIKNTEDTYNLTEIDKIINKYQQRKSVLFVPLAIKGKILGMLGVDRFQTLMEITHDDIESLQIFANHAAIIIEIARLYDAINREKMISENIIKSSVNGCIVSNLMGQIQTINPKASEILGMNEEEAKNQFIQNILGFSSSEAKKIYQAFKKSGPIRYYEKNYVNRNGKRYVLDLASYAIIAEKNNIYGAVTIIYDLTEKKKMDNYLMRVEKFAALGRVVSGIAHEIRNPLAGIYTTAQNIQNEIEENDSIKVDLKNIMEEINRVETLIRDILNLAKPLPLQIKEVNINNLLLTTINLIMKQAEKKGITVETQLDHSLKNIKMDPNRIRQVLLNIIINAIEAIKEKGKIIISTEMIREKDNQDEWLLITCRDNGVGIPQQVIGKIFDPFFTTKNVGTGLGLTVSHQIILDHKGMLEIESYEQEETTVHIRLPNPP